MIKVIDNRPDKTKGCVVVTPEDQQRQAVLQVDGHKYMLRRDASTGEQYGVPIIVREQKQD